MSHMIDMSNDRANIAYVGDEPWHELGTRLEEGRTIDEWAVAAGLSHEVRWANVEYTVPNTGRFSIPKRRVLYRSDTNMPLSVVSSNYQIVQPREVLEFFDKMTRAKGISLETAGSLEGGKRIWALAKLGEGAPVIGQDVVDPYLLLATSYDKSTPTISKFTTIRVVCHNTLSAATYFNEAKRELDALNSAKEVRVTHSQKFDADKVRLELGVYLNAFDRFLIDARKLAKKPVNKTFAVEFLKQLLPPAVQTITNKDGTRTVVPKPVEETKGFQQIMALFQGEALGASMREANGTAWGLLNAVTQHVDHQRGRAADTRMTSAWFGAGDDMKDKARELLLEVVA